MSSKRVIFASLIIYKQHAYYFSHWTMLVFSNVWFGNYKCLIKNLQTQEQRFSIVEKKIVGMFFAQIKDRRFSELKILLEMKNDKLVALSLVYILCFRLIKSTQFIFKKSWKIISWTNFFVEDPKQLPIIYFPKFWEDHPGFRSPNLLSELIIKILLQMFLT